MRCHLECWGQSQQRWLPLPAKNHQRGAYPLSQPQLVHAKFRIASLQYCPVPQAKGDNGVHSTALRVSLIIYRQLS